MIRKLLATTVLTSAMLLGACTSQVAGEIDHPDRYGTTIAANSNAQIAYGNSEGRLRDLSQELLAKIQAG